MWYGFRSLCAGVRVDTVRVTVTVGRGVMRPAAAGGFGCSDVLLLAVNTATVITHTSAMLPAACGTIRRYGFFGNDRILADGGGS